MIKLPYYFNPTIFKVRKFFLAKKLRNYIIYFTVNKIRIGSNFSGKSNAGNVVLVLSS